MRKLFIALFFFLSADVYSSTLICNNGMLSKGDSIAEIKVKCPQFVNAGYESSLNGKTREVQKITKLVAKLNDGTKITLIVLNDEFLTHIIH
ncbi:hypothetical protein [Photobacterium leiognathi]|uniref:hypothetical protein n=1 Tax=Photobacterium leiognathi TaxID=553611 RepID=UPI002980A7E8|nr:hypothetical protein [Photobacterium leiognathi]